MPHYDYRCRACGHQFEIFQSMSEAKLTECPECEGEVERLIGAGAGLIFKGSGFYTTDYRSDSYKKAASKDGGTSSSKSDPSGKSGKSDKSDKSDGGGTSTSKSNGKSKTKTSSSSEKSSKSKSD